MKQKLILLTVLLTALSASATPSLSYYTLTVNSGTGGGSYTNGTQVEIAADAPAGGRAFYQWIGDTQYVASVTSSNTTVTMPAQDVSLTATYTNLPGWYTLTVNSGTGSGTYTNGAQVPITPDAPPTGKAFSLWIDDESNSSDIATNIVTMPARNASVNATYTNLPGWYTLTVTNGTGGGTYTNETQVLITASNAPEGQAFDRWAGDTQVVDSITASTATVTMPTNEVSLTATYTNLPGWHTLTVGVGAGSGTYSNGQQVAIMADAPAVGKAFDQWTGDTQYLASVTSSNTTVTMPAQDISLTAVYVDVYYVLTVNNSSGGGSYTNGTQVLIVASNAPPGQAFDQWTGDTQYVASVTSSTTTVSMPAQAVVLTATYKTVYALAVTNGAGSGSYTNGERVAIAANAPASGKTFDRWTGDTQYVGRVTSSNTTVTMPARAIALTATYKDASYTLTITGGTGGGSYTNARVVSITANAPATGRAFDRWTGDTQYVASVTSTNTTVTMPTNTVRLTATYTNLPGWYTLTVTSGTGGGRAYTNGTQVLITANARTGKAFVQWIGDTQVVASVTSSNITVTMPAQDISLTATYEDIYYTLTVNHGTGSGTYTNGTRIAIAPDAPPTGQAFSRWIDSEANWSDIANLTVTMPAQDDFVTATYTNLPGWYTLTVTNGTGGGAYTNGTQVLIAASNAPTGQAFDRWIGDTQVVDSATSTNATVTMSTNAVSLTATYTNLPGWYTLTVTNGTAGSGPYTNGTQVLITASNAPRGQAFARWTGATQYVASVTSSNTTVTMPAQDIFLTATYTNLPGWYTLTVNNGFGGGRYTNGTLVWVAADAPEAGKTFKGWTGDVRYVAGHVASYVSPIPPATTVVTMPATNISVTATYGYYLKVYRGAASGFYTNGQRATLTFWPLGAFLPPGWAFDRWTGDTQYVANVTSTVTFVTMPAASAVCIADFRDVQSPAVTAISPTNGEHVGDMQIKVTGKVTDNDGATDIFIQFNGGGWMTNSLLVGSNGVIETVWTNNQRTTGWTTNDGFSGTTSWATNDVFFLGVATNIIGPTTNNGRFGTTSWTNSLTLQLGITNVLQIYARDRTGNISTTNTLNFVYVLAGDLNIQTNGPGVIMRTPAGVPEIGLTYTLTAIPPKKGTVFAGWTGSEVSTNRVLSFTMTSNMMFTANFTDIQKPAVAITYPAAKKLQRVVTNGAVVLRGTAADNDRLAGVMHQLYTGEWTNAVTTNGWKNWTAGYSPVTGLNTARVYSVDRQGNVSATSTVVFTYAPGAVIQVRTNGPGSITPAYNGQMLEIGKSYTMTAKAAKTSVFTNWTYGVGGPVATNRAAITFVMQSNLVLAANFRSLSAKAAMAAAIATPTTAIMVDGLVGDWANVPCSSFSYASVTQEVAVVLDGNSIALLLTDCPFDTTDNVLVYFKLRLSYGIGDNRHSVDLWTSGAVLYGMVDGQVISGLEAVLLNGVLEVKLPVEQAPSQVTIEELGCGLDLGGGTLTELFKIVSP